MSEENNTESTLSVEGILEPTNNRNGVLLNPRRHGKLRREDPFVPKELIRRFKLKKGSYICGKAQHGAKFQNPKVCFIDTVDGLNAKDRKELLPFQDLLTVAPDDHLRLEHSDGRLTTRIIDLFCPVGKGQRGLIVAPPRTGKTT